MDGTNRIEGDEAVEAREPAEIGAGIDSVTLARLLEEVRNADDLQPTSYNRMHNRHNRS